jgi:nucleoside-diphosphate-sugar epimerase
MRILITGENSFLGRNFIQYSKFKNVKEISLLENQPEVIDFGQFDIVIHMAAIVYQSRKISEKEYFLINKDLCLRVAENAKKTHVRQFIFMSTVKVYGKFITGSEPLHENSICNPESLYGKSKYEAEKALRELEDEDFIVSIIRTPLVYGEGVKANLLSLVKLVRYSYILPFKNVENRRNYCYAENLVGYIDRIIDKRSSGIFISSDENAISTTDLVKMISDSLGKSPILFKVPDFIIRLCLYISPDLFDGLYGSMEINNDQTLRKLGYKPQVPMTEGIRKTVYSIMNKSGPSERFWMRTFKRNDN